MSGVPLLPRGALPVLLALLLFPGLASGQGQLDLIDRFGPDGLPFTWDDPLNPGASAAEFRFGAMAADACSEETGMAEGASAHGHPAKHAPIADTHLQPDQWANKLHQHTARVTPENMLNGLVLEAPFDFTSWVLALNLEDASTSRFRLFPEDLRWTNPMDADPIFGRGWGRGTGWVGSEATPDMNGNSMNDIWSGPAKNLHLEAMGMTYRDLKPGGDNPDFSTGTGGGIAIGIKKETLELYPRFPPALADADINLFSEQNYLEGWVLELVNLDNHQAGVSGNFIADLAGLRISIALSNYRQEEPFSESFGPFTFSGTCVVEVDDFVIEFGGPVKWSTIAENSKTPSRYVLDNYLQDITDRFLAQAEFSGSFPCDVANLLSHCDDDCEWNEFRCKAKRFLCRQIKPKVEEAVEEQVTEELDKLDTIAALVGDEDYRVIGKYSGLAGRKGKNPFDKVAVGSLEYLGQFKPHTWLPWQVVGDIPTAFDFDISAAGLDIQTTKDAMEASNPRWRYNNGSSYLTKSAMLFGNSAGQDDDPERHTALSPLARRAVPDVLRSFAEQFIHLRMDIVDPYKKDIHDGQATWQSEDILFPHIGDEFAVEEFTLDWPPPNWNFGAAQVVGNRSGSGGIVQVPNNDTDPATVLVDGTMQSNWLLCVDPVSRTYSTAGTMFRKNYTPQATSDLSIRGADFGWTPPLSYPDDLDTILENRSGLRWLTAGATRYMGEQAVLQWMWDFENDGQLDSDHGQHMSDLGDSPNFGQARFTSVFAYQPRDAAGDRGLTGFRLIPANLEAHQLAAP